jgi:hypothetical protein
MSESVPPSHALQRGSSIVLTGPVDIHYQGTLPPGTTGLIQRLECKHGEDGAWLFFDHGPWGDRGPLWWAPLAVLAIDPNGGPND